MRLNWNRLKRAVFLCMALCIVVSLPLTASASEAVTARGETSPTAVVRLNGVVKTLSAVQQLFVSRVYQVTDEGIPRERTTRGQYLALLYEAAGTPEVTVTATFTDVTPDADYAHAVAWAEQLGVVRGDREGRLRPDEELTGEMAQALFVNVLGALGSAAKQVMNSVLAAYTGRNSDEDWASAALMTAAPQDGYGEEAAQYPHAALGPPESPSEALPPTA